VYTPGEYTGGWFRVQARPPPPETGNIPNSDFNWDSNRKCFRIWISIGILIANVSEFGFQSGSIWILIGNIPNSDFNWDSNRKCLRIWSSIGIPIGNASEFGFQFGFQSEMLPNLDFNWDSNRKYY
jgi:hypothetical protein